jgi:hypothetical protein
MAILSAIEWRAELRLGLSPQVLEMSPLRGF